MIVYGGGGLISIDPGSLIGAGIGGAIEALINLGILPMGFSPGPSLMEQLQWAQDYFGVDNPQFYEDLIQQTQAAANNTPVEVLYPEGPYPGPVWPGTAVGAGAGAIGGAVAGTTGPAAPAGAGPPEAVPPPAESPIYEPGSVQPGEVPVWDEATQSWKWVTNPTEVMARDPLGLIASTLPITAESLSALQLTAPMTGVGPVYTPQTPANFQTQVTEGQVPETSEIPPETDLSALPLIASTLYPTVPPIEPHGVSVAANWQDIPLVPSDLSTVLTQAPPITAATPPPSGATPATPSTSSMPELPGGGSKGGGGGAPMPATNYPVVGDNTLLQSLFGLQAYQPTFVPGIGYFLRGGR